MLLVADVGNTNTKIGVFEGPRLLVSWRLTSRREQTADEYGIFFETLLRTRGIQASDIRGIALSNVVPPVQQTLERMCEEYFGHPPFSVEPGVNVPMALAVDNPREVGPDRIVDAYAAAVIYGPPLIVIDLGTATTFHCVNARGEFVGGAIAPGISTAVDSLVARAARPFRVGVVRVERGPRRGDEGGARWRTEGHRDGGPRVADRRRGALDPARGRAPAPRGPAPDLRGGVPGLTRDAGPAPGPSALTPTGPAGIGVRNLV